MESACDATGFSLGFAGLTSGLYVGGSYYDGTPHGVDVIAHEAGHAVHREFMAEHQPVAAYNTGPHWAFESFAIFNELLFYDYMYRNAKINAERAYYLNEFLDDATFQIFGSSEETDLEASIYRNVAAGKIRTATDLDALTMQVFERYDPSVSTTPEIRDYWARDGLYFTDPLYDVNYLYAGLLALQYYSDFEKDPEAFSKRYVALLQNGFDAPAAALEKRFLGIDLRDEASLVRNATTLIDARSALLGKLYASAST
jgi:oligoendopeptidase F